MNKKAKITAAISAAVFNYIRTEEENLMISQSGLSAGQLASGGGMASVAPPFNMWGVSGRQDLMRMRNMMQFRAFARGRQ